MLYLSFMRHAKSDWCGPSANDIIRPISKKGIKKTKAVSKYLKNEKMEFDSIFCSPSLRTKQTLSCFLQHSMHKDVEIVEDQNIYEGSEENFLLRISKIKKYKNVLVITHEPQISFFVNYFLSDTKCFKKVSDLRFVTSSITTIGFDIKSWNDISNINAKFIRFIDPNLLLNRIT
ncbi:MAG: histidine phosphatase family protein [Pseudomonadota bacterium]|nr:histidine phosphatase family protein [Pseudomonadota bacterium]